MTDHATPTDAPFGPEITTLDMLITARRKDLGGFEVGRVLPFARRRMVGPFIFFDHMGPVTLPPNIPRSTDVRPHPHIGLSTLTYLFDGAITHRDSVGSEQVIRPHEANWMTAGSGITHSERFDGPIRAQGGVMNGIQAWIALPDEAEECPPSFAHFDAPDLPELSEPGITHRLIAGDAYGAKSPIAVSSPLFYLHATLAAGARFTLPTGLPERAAYIVSGTLELEGRSYHPGDMLILHPGSHPTLTAHTPTTLMLLGGEPLGPRHIWWNFVSSRPERIEQAKADWKAGRISLPQADHEEWIPLSEELKAPEAMS